MRRHLCYLPETDEIAGLCEHSKALGSLKMGSDLSTIDAVATAVRKTKEVHVGHEVSVAAFAKLDADDYGAKPVLLLPTRKKGDYRDAALQLQMLLEAWKISPYGARLHGDVWSIASDGDPKRRPALYLLCMARKLVETDALYKHVGRLRVLNLYCGRNFETAAFDWKHNWKSTLYTISIVQILIFGLRMYHNNLRRGYGRERCLNHEDNVSKLA